MSDPEGQMQDTMRRDPNWDVLKLIVMLMVVYGHVTELFRCETFRPYDGNFIVGMF